MTWGWTATTAGWATTANPSSPGGVLQQQVLNDDDLSGHVWIMIILIICFQLLALTMVPAPSPVLSLTTRS